MKSILSRFDGNDALFYMGLFALFVGLVVKYSLDDALIVVGSVFATVSVVNSYVLTILASRMTRKD